MNLHTPSRAMPFLAMLVIALVLIALPRLDSLFFANLRYSQCTSLSVSDPQKALKLAHTWRARSPLSPLAQHCAAIALYATQDYTHAAEAFIALAKAAQASNPTLANKLLEQAAQAYEAAGQPDRASSLPIDINKNNDLNGSTAPPASLPPKNP